MAGGFSCEILAGLGFPGGSAALARGSEGGLELQVAVRKGSALTAMGLTSGPGLWVSRRLRLQQLKHLDLPPQRLRCGDCGAKVSVQECGSGSPGDHRTPSVSTSQEFPRAPLFPSRGPPLGLRRGFWPLGSPGDPRGVTAQHRWSRNGARAERERLFACNMLLGAACTPGVRSWAAAPVPSLQAAGISPWPWPQGVAPAGLAERE